MISGSSYRRGRALLWSTVASVALHVIILTLLFYAVARLIVQRGEREVVSRTEVVAIEQRPTPAPAVHRVARHVRQRESAPATTRHHELAKTNPAATPQPPAVHRVSSIERDQAGFANEVAQLNREDDIHAIPTIDPASQGSTMKSYQFDVASRGHGDEHGNGIITPTQSWRDAGRDCYYGRYEYTYPDGAMEDGEIAWPFCFDPAADPFKRPPHPMPFPLPLPGYRLPPDTQLPPIEKEVYDDWAGSAALRSTP